MGGRLAKVGLMTLSLVLAVGAAELVLDLIDYEYRPMRITTGADNDARLYHLFRDENFVWDPQSIWRPKADFGVFNSLGFRGEELGPREPGEVRLAAVGDSNTLGWSGEDGANWPAYLEQAVRAAGVEAEVINAGVWGYSSQQGVPRTREVLALEPDLVLISFGSNDAHLVARSDAEFSGRSERSWRAIRTLRKLRVAQLVTAFLDGLDPASAEPRPRVSLDDYRANLRLMVAEVRAAGGVPVLLTRPYVGTVIGTEVWKHRAPEYNLATVEVAASEGVLLIDVYSVFKERDSLFADESHFTREGHRLAASMIADHLRPLLPDQAGGEAAAGGAGAQSRRPGAAARKTRSSSSRRGSGPAAATSE